ncbi:type VI secretion system-associated FHA domain protein TagH [Thiorhodococcus minor]|uniref:Type VI secretion system-associated FHA domain protein TagH n=1 Tax=Thiorhodococcus minor TaxID=57489 RepID=A0A6M0K300_9GAMM|nr:type VI secretion system-associated FHA domain protein TagH [Thiorhodococcus minor]NEV63333.1 type VI secretion system-associated FHA domain protein TagH [Thiorhodococcus minor]
MKPKLELALSVLTYDGRPPKRALAARVAGDTCVIGRHASCQLELPDPDREISGHHVLIYRRDGGFSVTDVSTNGTFLNEAEEPLDPSQAVDLRDGDRLTIGRYVVEVAFAQAAGAPSQADEVGEPSVAADPVPARSACPDILDLIGPAPTDLAGEAPDGQAMPTPGAATEQLAVVPEALLTPGLGGAELQAPGADSGRLPAGDARQGPELPQDAAGGEAPAPSLASFVPDPADVPTMLVQLQNEPARATPGATDHQGMAPPRDPGPESPVPSSRERPPSALASAKHGPVAADAPTQILPAPDLPALQRPAEEGGREPAAPREGTQEQPAALGEGHPAGRESLVNGHGSSRPVEARAASAETAEMPRVGGQSVGAVLPKTPSTARPQPPQSSASLLPPPATPAAPQQSESGVDASRAGAGADVSPPAQDGSASLDAPTVMVKVAVSESDAVGRARADRDAEPRGGSPAGGPGQSLPGVLGGGRAAAPPVQAELRHRVQRATAPGPALDLSDAAATAIPPGLGVSQAPSGGAGAEAAQTISGETRGSEHPVVVDERPTAPPAPKASPQPPITSDADPGRTTEGPRQAVGHGRAQVLDDATRIRAPSEPAPAKPLSPSELGQIEAFLAGLGAGSAEEIGDAARLMRTSGALLRTMTQGLVTAAMAQEHLNSELRRGMPAAPPEGGNPFRFCLDIDDTLARVLWRPGCEYLDPSAAARQAFDAIEVHQAASMAGLRAVLKALLARLEPHAIEQEIGAQAGLGQLLPNARKARCWDLFMAAFEEIADDVSEDFAKVFGDAFTHAYDDEAERLRRENQGRRAKQGR